MMKQTAPIPNPSFHVTLLGAYLKHEGCSPDINGSRILLLPTHTHYLEAGEGTDRVGASRWVRLDS